MSASDGACKKFIIFYNNIYKKIKTKLGLTMHEIFFNY